MCDELAREAGSGPPPSSKTVPLVFAYVATSLTTEVPGPVTLPPPAVTVIAGVVVGLVMVQPETQETDVTVPLPPPPPPPESNAAEIAGEVLRTTFTVPLESVEARRANHLSPATAQVHVPFAVALVTADVLLGGWQLTAAGFEPLVSVDPVNCTVPDHVPDRVKATEAAFVSRPEMTQAPAVVQSEPDAVIVEVCCARAGATHPPMRIRNGSRNNRFMCDLPIVLLRIMCDLPIVLLRNNSCCPSRTNHIARWSGPYLKPRSCRRSPLKN